MRGVSAQILELGAPATGVHWVDERALFARGDGAITISDERTIKAHDGAILCSALAPDGAHILTGGDDGRLMMTGLGGGPRERLQLKSKWIDHVVASAASGVIVAAAGKDAHVLKEDAALHVFTYPSTIGGLALDAKGRRLAASHYGGATLRYALMADDAGVALKWAGSHLAIALEPQAEFVITAMQELELHGWRVSDKKDLRMSGYAAKTRNFTWDRRGRWLATSGADCAVLWPFVGKMGPQGKPPLLLGRREALVTRVAFHPREEIVAIGYADGAVLIADIAENATAEIIAPTGAPIAALAWSAVRMQLAAGDEAGRAHVMELQARASA